MPDQKLSLASLMEKHRLSQPVALGIPVYLMLWVAIFNGYPLLYDDTGGYITDGFTLWQIPYRSIVYSIFIRLASWGTSPWVIVLAQSVVTIFVLRTVFAYIIAKRATLAAERWYFLALAIFLAFTTSLPWQVGEIMPDLFSGLCFLSAFLLLYDSNLSLEKSALLSIVLAFSVGSHLSNFLSMGILLSTVFVLRAFKGTRQFWPTRTVKGIAAFVLLPIVATAGFIVFSNFRAGYGVTLSPGTPIFLLNRMLESRLADGYLEQQCKVETLTPCKYLQDLPRQTFVWGPHPLLTEMGGWLGARKEARKIVAGTIRRYPIRFLAECGKQMFRQFVAFRPGVDNYPYHEGPTVDTLESLYPGDMPKYRLTRQWSGRLQMFAKKIAPFYEIAFWASLLASLVLLLVRYSRSAAANRLFLLTLLFLFSNALVTASVSIVSDRYQSRVSWMMGLCFAAYIVALRLNGTKAAAERTETQ